MEQPEERSESKHVWEVEIVHHAARRFSLSGTALVRQESGGYPVRPVHCDPLADRPDFPPPSPTPTSRRMVEPPALRAPPSAASHRHF